MQQLRLERLVGAVVLVAAIIFVAQTYSRPGAGGGYRIDAAFGRIDGIDIGSPVQLGGVTIGKVVDITLDPRSFRPNLVLSVDSRYTLPTDSTAAIRGDGLIGAKYVKLLPGAAETRMPPGGRIDLTEDVIDIEGKVRRIVELATEK